MKVALNRSYRELARHHGFKIAPTPPYSPEDKGKVESAVKYAKNNLFAARPDELVLAAQNARDAGASEFSRDGNRTHVSVVIVRGILSELRNRDIDPHEVLRATALSRDRIEDLRRSVTFYELRRLASARSNERVIRV